MKERIYLNNDWSFSSEYDEKMVDPKFKGKLETVRLPHSVVETPFNNFDAKVYQKTSLYRKEFLTEKEWADHLVILTIEAAAHDSEVFINGVSVAKHHCGYTAFSADLTPHLAPAGKKNVLCVKVDSNESLNIPPFGFVIDYMTYGGIYRDVYLDVKNPVYIDDVYVYTKSNTFNTEITLNTTEGTEGYTYTQKVVVATDPKTTPSAEITTGVSGKKTLTSAQAQPVVAWSLDKPVLYNLVTELRNAKGKVVDTKTVRFGFRDIRYDETGFYLNNKKIKIRGLNRHQSWPYVGYAMPKNMQIDDADILKYELGLNEVRTSHYPQSQYFIDRCDEIGLLVFTEIPGWQHIGNEEWKNQAVENVKDMVMQYRNHPSIFLWGVRINESQDCDDLYERTNKAAHELDSRPTGGVRFLKHSHLLEDVYTYNDFSHIGTNAGAVHKKEVTNTNKGYMVTEYNGHMFPTKTFDCESHRTEHAIRHANVLDTVASYDDISGSSGWCAFDYNTHKDFGSGDRICYHGVMDMFRNPKLASYVYAAQGNVEDTGDVLAVTSSMDIGEYPGGAHGSNYVFTNADSVKLYVNKTFIKEYKGSASHPNLKHGPILIDDYIGNRLIDNENIKPKYSEQIKELLQALRIYGMDQLPFKYKLLGVHLWLHRVATVASLRELYNKYIGNWGGESTAYKFEAYRDGKVVKTVIKAPAKEIRVDAFARRSELIETTSYDATEIYLRAVDDHGNILPYCQEAVTIKTEGPVELIGPAAVSLKGGMAGTYVKTTGKAGKAAVIITDWVGNTVKVPLSVKVKK